MNNFPNPLNQMLSGLFSGDAFKSGLGEMLQGLKMTYDKLCEVAVFTAPPIASKTRSGTVADTVLGQYANADILVAPVRGKRFDLFLYDNNAVVQWGPKVGAALNDECEYIAPGFYSLPAAVGIVKIRSAVLANKPRYSLTIWT